MAHDTAWSQGRTVRSPRVVCSRAPCGREWPAAAGPPAGGRAGPAGGSARRQALQHTDTSCTCSHADCFLALRARATEAGTARGRPPANPARALGVLTPKHAGRTARRVRNCSYQCPSPPGPGRTLGHHRTVVKMIQRIRTPIPITTPATNRIMANGFKVRSRTLCHHELIHGGFLVEDVAAGQRGVVGLAGLGLAAAVAGGEEWREGHAVGVDWGQAGPLAPAVREAGTAGSSGARGAALREHVEARLAEGHGEEGGVRGAEELLHLGFGWGLVGRASQPRQQATEPELRRGLRAKVAWRRLAAGRVATLAALPGPRPASERRV
jgi:hypothetical protein